MNTFDDNSGPFGSRTVPVDVQFASKLFSALGTEDHTGNEFVLIPQNYLDSFSKICYDYTMFKKFSRIYYLKICNEILDYWNKNDSIRSLNLNSYDLDKIFSGLLTLCQCIRKHFRNSQENFSQLRQSILNHSKMPEKIFDIIFDKFFINSPKCKRPNLVAFTNLDSIATGNRLISVRWQLNLAISDRFISKIMEPYVRFEFIYGSSDDQKKRMIFECRMKQFHQLRFTIAWLLKELNRLESNKILSKC